jgi:hypothetical protein
MLHIFFHDRFGEPFVDNIAHDTLVECSNAGICDRETGNCICEKGFEVLITVNINWIMLFLSIYFISLGI